MIVKIQIPLATNNKEPMALIYNEDKTFHAEIPAYMVEPLFPEGIYKIYADVQDKLGGDDNKKLMFNGYASEQNW